MEAHVAKRKKTVVGIQRLRLFEDEMRRRQAGGVGGEGIKAPT